MTDRPIYCCLPIEFIQPWEQNDAIRQVKACRLGNMVMLQGTFHVGDEEDRRRWKEHFPELAAQVDATPRFPERPRHGMAALFTLPLAFRLEQLRLCRELGLTVLNFFPSLMHLPPEEYALMLEAGRGLVLTEMLFCENLSLLGATLSPERLKQIDATPIGSHAEGYRAEAVGGPSIFDDPAAPDFQQVHDWFINRFRAAGAALRARGVDSLGAVEASSQMRLALEAGVDLPVLELVPHEPLRGLAAVRGAAKAYGKPLWGVHTALGYYRAPTDAWTPERLRIAFNLFYAGGASIFSECNLPLRNWGSCSGFFTIPGSPPIRQGEEECREFDDPLCARARAVVSEFYRFTQFHQRPAQGPRVRMGYLLGNLDAWGGNEGERMWLVDHPGFLVPDALRSWRHFDRVFDSEPWYIPPRKYYWQADPAKPLRHGTPPGGQVDLVPAEAPIEVLQSYGSLAFFGWNTMTEEQYARLTAYVEGGGTLFLAVPHLDTRTRGDQAPAYLRGGDVRDLCGVRILGSGEQVDELFFAEQTADARYLFPQGALYLEEAPLARLELHGARVLAHPRGKPEQPVLLEHRIGSGTVYLLAVGEYPGERLDAFITDILRTLAEGEQGEIAVESRDVFYAVYDGEMPSGQPCSTVYLVNHDIYGQPAYPALVVKGERVPLRVPGGDLRIAWVCENLLIAPHDKFVTVTDLQRTDNGWQITLEADGAGERLLQLAALTGTLGAATLDGAEFPLERFREGDQAIRCALTGRHLLQVVIAR